MDRVASVAALFVTFGLVAAYASPPTYARSQIDGLYVIPQEVRGYQNAPPGARAARIKEHTERGIGANDHRAGSQSGLCAHCPTQPGDHQRVNAE